MGSGNWIVDNLNSALQTWNDKLAEIWTLISTTPEDFKGGGIWNVIVSINGALQAIGYIQHIHRVYLIILRHLMEHGFFLGGCVPDIACGQLIAGTQHEIIVKVDADIGAVLQRSQVVAVVVARRQEPKQETSDRVCGIGYGDIFRNDNGSLCLAVEVGVFCSTRQGSKSSSRHLPMWDFQSFHHCLFL